MDAPQKQGKGADAAIDPHERHAKIAIHDHRTSSHHIIFIEATEKPDRVETEVQAGPLRPGTGGTEESFGLSVTPRSGRRGPERKHAVTPRSAASNDALRR